MERVFNQGEAGLWLIVAVVFVLKACRARAPLRRVFMILGAAFLAFGVSDVIEAESGAWWDPPWLLVLKTGCVAAMVWGFRRYYRLTARTNSRTKPDL